jgi:WD40 repeat protein
LSKFHRANGCKNKPIFARVQQDVTWLAWSPDGKRLAWFSEGEKPVLLWDVAKGELPEILKLITKKRIA